MRDVYVVDGLRTPFIKVKGHPNTLRASDLAVNAGRVLLGRQSFSPHDFDEVIMGCVCPRADEANISRIISLRLGMSDRVPAWTVQRNCASGLQAVDSARLSIASGNADLVLAGGTEAMSHAPLIFSDEMAHWLGRFGSKKKFLDKLKMLFTFKPSFFKPVISLMKGLTDPVVNLTMGQTAENIAYEYGISRAEMDEFAVLSHKRAKSALENNFLDEVTPMFTWNGENYDVDNGIREDSTVEKLGKLKAVFDKPVGLVTAGNSSQVTDGAALLILASQDALDKYNLEPLCRLKSCSWVGLDPAVMGLGPAAAIGDLIKKESLSLDDVDYFEINEAFSAQVLGCVKALNDKNFCESQFKSSPLGSISPEKLNIDGGAIAIGHPVGASGARIILHTAHVLNRTQKRFGIASLCIGGGQGGAMLVESVRGA